MESRGTVGKPLIRKYTLTSKGERPEPLSNYIIYKTPFKKWYIKGYTNKSDNLKIVNFILGFSDKKLNKNLIVKMNISTIVNINYLNNPG